MFSPNFGGVPRERCWTLVLLGKGDDGFPLLPVAEAPFVEQLPSGDPKDPALCACPLGTVVCRREDAVAPVVRTRRHRVAKVGYPRALHGGTHCVCVLPPPLLPEFALGRRAGRPPKERDEQGGRQAKLRFSSVIPSG